MRRIAPRVALCFWFFATAVSLHAASFTSSQNGNWSSASTWGGTGVPGAGDTATVNHTVTLDVTVTVSTLTLGGTLNGSQPITITTAFNWNGGTLTGSGGTSIPIGSVATLGSYSTLDGRPLTIAGTFNETSSYYFYMLNNASLTNSGTIDFQGDGGIYISGTVGTTAINNSGTIKKSLGSGTANITVPLKAQSGSQLLVQSGTLDVSAVTATSATFDVSSGANLVFNSNDTRTFDAASTISGAGTVNWQSGTNTVSGNYNVTGTTTSSGATTTLSSITSTGALNITFGTLTLNGASTLTVPTLTISGGTLTGTLPITFGSTPMTWSGGTISGSGLMTIPAGKTVNVASVVLDGRPLTNAGTINLTSSYMYVGNNAVITNSGAINMTSDGSLYMNGTVGTTALVNSGTITKSAGTSGSTLNVPLTMQNGSSLDTQASILYMGPIAATGAAFTLSSGATLYFYYADTRTFDATSSISGAGTVQIGNGTNTINANYNISGTTICSGGTATLNAISSTGSVTMSGGTLTLNSASAITIPTLTMGFGTLNGTAPINVTNPAMTWTNGTISGSGLLSIANGTTVTMTTLVLDGRPLTNAGVINMVSNGTWYIGNNSVVTNNGTVDLQGDSSISMNGTVGSTMFVNGGTIRKSSGASGSAMNVPLTMQSGSQLLDQSSIFYLGQIAATNATFNVSSGATLYFYYSDTRTFDAASSISGGGTVQWASGTNTVNASYSAGATIHSGGTTTLSNITSTGNLTASGGTLTLNSASAITIPTLTMSGAILNGTAPINVTAASMSWNNGTFSGSGQLSIPNGTTISINSSLFITGTPVSNAGVINLTGGSMYIGGNSSFSNTGTIDLQGDGSISMNGAVGTTAITNSGTIKKSAGTASGSSFTVPLVAQSGSQFLAQAGTFYLGPVTATSATFDASNTATLYFYYFDTRTFDAASTVSSGATATVQWGNGTNTVNGTYNVAGTTNCSGGTTTLNNITSIGNLNLTGGTLTLNSGSALAIPTLTVGGGILNGTAPINVTASSMTWNSGTFGGSGAITIPSGTTITLSYMTFDGRPVTNNGTINIPSTAYMYLANNAVLTNNNVFDLQGDGNIYISGPTGTTSFTNNGTLKKSAGTNGSTISVPLIEQSGSQLLVQASIIYAGAVTSTNATTSISSGATFVFYYGGASSFDSASTISGLGTAQFQGGTVTFAGTITTPVTVNGGTLTLNSAAAQTIPTLTMTGGTLNGTGAINVSGAAMNWSGGIISGSGTLTLSNATTVTITGGMTLDARPVTIAGSLAISGTSYMYVGNNAVITNNGTIDYLADGNLYLNGAAGSTAIVNNGTIRKTSGANSYLTVPLTTQSGSQFLVQSGIVYLGAVTSTSSTFAISSGATLYTYTGDARTFDAATQITGAGTFQQQSGSDTISGTISTNILCAGGTLTINSAAPQSVPTLVMNGGTLTGSANLTITGASMTWTGGTLSGSGTLVIPNGTTVGLSGGMTFDGRPVTLAGTFNINASSYAYLQNNAVITNSGLIDFLADGNVYLSGVPGTTAVVNSGTIRKSGGASYTYFTVPLTAQSGSQFLTQSGTILLGAVTSSGATFGISSGATLYTYTGDPRSFDAASQITGAGTFQQQSGTDTVSGTISTNVNVAGGTLTINSAATQSLPTLAMSGGTLNGSANITITGTSMTWTGGTISGSGTLTIPNGTTINITGYPFFDARPVTNAGTINFTTTNYAYVGNNSVITNSGLIDFQNDGNLYLNGAAGSTAVVNSGTIRKSGGANSYFTVPLTMQSGGQLLVQSGVVYLGAVTSSGGTFNVASGTTLYTYTSDVRTFDASTSILGAGTFQAQGGTNTISGTISANLQIGGGTTTINSASAQSIPVLTMSGGTLNGTAAVNVTGSAMTWSGGTISGSGAFTISSSSVISLTGYNVLDGRAVTNNGTLRFTAAVYLYLQNSAALTNNGTIDFQTDSSIVLNFGAATLTNNGTLMKSTGSGTSSVTVTTTNAAAGTIQAAAGTLTFNGLTNSGTLYFPIAGAASFGRVNVSGNFPLAGTLTATTVSGYTPANGTTFQVLTFGSSSGAFPNKNLDYAGGTFVESYAPTSLILSAGPQLLAITNVSPSRGANAGGTTVSITGSNFFATTSVTFGGVAAASVTYNNSTSLTAVTPAGTTGAADVVVTNPSAQTATLANGFTYTGLLAHYSFDVAGTPGKDVANSNDATSVSGVTQVSGKVGQAASFSSGVMTLPATPSFNLRTGGDFTLDAWVNSSSASNADWFMKGSAGPLYGLTANAAQAVFSFDNGSGGSVTSISNIFDGAWHHVAAVHRGSSAELWIDGKLETTQSVSGTADGGVFSLGQSYAGLIDEAKLYNYALSTSEIRADALAPDVAISKSATPTVTVGQNITYSITVTNNGPVAATNVTVADPLPAGTSFVSATPSQGSCSGNPNVICALGGISSGNNATITIIATATSAGTRTNTANVTANETDPVTANNSASASTTVSTSSCAAPTITASGPITFCAGGSVTLTANATGATSYQWYLNGNPIGSANGTTYAAGASGNYSVTVTYPSACSAGSATTAVTVNPLPATPSITAGGPTTFCNGGSVTLTAPAGYNYVWSNSATTQSITVTTSGNYTVTVVDANGCSATSAPTTVTVTTIAAPTITPSGPTTFCGGGSVTLTATAGYASYAWSNGATSQSTTVGTSGNYTVTVTDASGCVATSAPTTVSVTPAPAVTISGPGFTCPATPVTLDAGSGYTSYSWSTGATSQTITVTPPAGGATYSVSVTNGSGCSGSASHFVAVGNTVTPAISGPSAACPGIPITLDAGAGFTSYLWSNGATTQSITVTQNATTTYSVTVGSGTCSGSASKTVTMNVPPSVTITGPSTICPNTSFTLDAGPGFAAYAWSTGATTQTITVPQTTVTQTYSVTVTDANGCTASDTHTVTLGSGASATITAPATAQPNATGLTASVAAGPAGTTYAWSVTNGTITAGQGTPSITFSVGTTTATLDVTVTSGSCTATGTKTVQITNTADLSLTISASPDPVTAGTALTYLIAVTNHGPSSASSITVTDTLPAGVTFVSASGSGWTCNGSGPVQCTMPLLPAGPASISIAVKAPLTAGTITNSASIASATTDPKPSNNNFAVTTLVNAAANCPSAAPALVAPAQNATVTSNVTFSWQPVAQATGYRVWVSVDGAPDEEIGTTNGATTLTHVVNAGNVTWVVDALFNGCPATRSARGAFTIPKSDPCAGHAAPALLAPANNSTSQSSGIDFQWTAVADASGYRLWAAIDGGAPAVLGETGATSLHAVISNGAVDWFVEALFDGCPSVASAHSLVTVPKAQNCGDEKPTLVSPADNSTTPSASVQFNWNSVAGATGYELYLALDNGSPVLIGTTSSATSLTKEVAAGKLQWFVRALFDGCPSRDSQAFTFTYAPPANCKPNQRPLLASPIDGSTVTSPVSFEWSNAGASSYKLFVNTEQLNNPTTQQLPPGHYEWYVEAHFDGCATLRSTTSEFTVVAKPQGCVIPDRPTLLAPSQVSTNVAYKVRWLPSLGADAYVVQEANNAAFANATTFPQTTDNKLTLSHAEPGTFFYRVRGISSCATEPGAFSTVVGVSILPQNGNDGAASPDSPVTLTYSIALDAALAGQNFTATPTEPWLTVTPSSGTVPAGGLTLTVAANTAGLPLGTSLGGVTISTGTPSSSRYASSGNTTSTTTLTVNVVQPVSPTSKSSPPPDALIIPAVAHADGFNSHFQSDIRLTNTSPQPMKYQLTFTPSGEDGLPNGKQSTIDVDPGRTIALDDVLTTWFSSGSTDGSTGTLEIRPLTSTSSKVTSNAISGLANLVTFASSRTFNNASNGTYGQYIPAIPFANFIGKGAGTITLQQIAQSVNYRTNLGLVEGSGQPVSLLVSIFGSNGQKIKDFPVDLKGGQHTQLNSFLATQGLNLENARVEVKVASGSGRVTAYASVLDNKTSDPLLVTPTLLTSTGSAKYVLPGVADLGAWHSDVRIFNASSTKVDAQLMFVSQTGAVQTQSLTLGPNEVKELDNLLQSTFGVTNDGGALHISTASPSNLIATARTYNASANGTYGQFISAVTPNDAAALGTRPLQLLQIEESDRYRTNVGIAEVSGKPAKVEVTVVPPDSKVSAVVDLDLAANEFRQLNQVLKSVGMDNTYNARVTVQVIDGAGKVTAYASVIDATTQDPTLLQAQ